MLHALYFEQGIPYSHKTKINNVKHTFELLVTHVQLSLLIGKDLGQAEKSQLLIYLVTLVNIVAVV